MDEKRKRLKDLKEHWQSCSKCEELCQSRQRIVFGWGEPDASLMLISDKPGIQEDETGIPMSGQAGDYYQQTLERLGLRMSEVWTTNVVMCLPPDNRDPFDYECDNCKERLYQEILIVDPDIIVVAGKTALRTLLGIKTPISSLQLKTFVLSIPGVMGNVDYPVIVTYNPAVIMRRPGLNRHQPWHFFYQALKQARDVTRILWRARNGEDN